VVPPDLCCGHGHAGAHKRAQGEVGGQENGVGEVFVRRLEPVDRGESPWKKLASSEADRGEDEGVGSGRGRLIMSSLGGVEVVDLGEEDAGEAMAMEEVVERKRLLCG
jgi:hypothetical protein